MHVRFQSDFQFSVMFLWNAFHLFCLSISWNVANRRPKPNLCWEFRLNGAFNQCHWTLSISLRGWKTKTRRGAANSGRGQLWLVRYSPWQYLGVHAEAEKPVIKWLHFYAFFSCGQTKHKKKQPTTRRWRKTHAFCIFCQCLLFFACLVPERRAASRSKQALY